MRGACYFAWILAACAAACQSPVEESPSSSNQGIGLQSATGRTLTPDEARAVAAANAELARSRFRGMTFEQFEETVWQEPAELGGKYVVNGDQPILDEKHLREFFEKEVQRQADPGALTDFRELILHRPGGQNAVWNDTMQRQLSFCVSTSFGARHQTVVDAMQTAAGAWEACADVDFVYESGENGTCNASNPDIVFDVRPVDVNGQYLARAFFPNEPRAARNVLIDESAFELDPSGKLTLVGILRHELGHALGFRHEHTRPESGTCFEDADWGVVTDYDALSVMHYPQCNGGGDWSLVLTATDKNGAACVYGPAAGFTMDPSIAVQDCREAVDTPCAPTTKVLTGTVAKGQEKLLGPFAVAAGSSFEAVMTGTGDPDLYVRYDQPPTTQFYDCRPFLSGANETCSLSVPANESSVHVMVRGYAAGTFTLTVTHTP